MVGTYLTHEPDCESLRLDVCDAAAVMAAVEQLRPEQVIHTAYDQEREEVNREGAANVAAAAGAVGARLVHVSTDVVFGGGLGRPYRESDRPDPVTAYGAAKAAAEELVAERCPGAAIVRTSMLLAGEEPSRHEQVALEAAAGRAPYAFYDDELRCPVAVADAAAALIEVAQTAHAGPLHVAGADALSRYALACLMAEAGGRPVDLIPRTTGAAKAGRPADCRLDSGLAHSLLTTRLRGVRELFLPPRA